MPSPLLIELWAVERLSPYHRPLRKNDHAVDRMITSIGEYGFAIPLLVSADGQIIDGHLRLKASQKLGFTEVPVIVCDDWTPARTGSGSSDFFGRVWKPRVINAR
jgi:ParB-like nuclease domain